MNTTILLNSGNYFDFSDIENQTLDVHDIAHGLSMTCRFGGHCNKFYSVAEHSVWVSRLVPPEYAMIGLLHDASESVLGDMPKPLKNIMPEYSLMEEKLEITIARQYNIQFPYPPEIKQEDIKMLITEQSQLFSGHIPKTGVFEKALPYDFRLLCLTPEQAYIKFMERYRQLKLDGF